MAIVFGSNAARQILRRDCIKLRGYDPDKLHPKKFPGRYIAGAWEIELLVGHEARVPVDLRISDVEQRRGYGTRKVGR